MAFFTQKKPKPANRKIRGLFALERQVANVGRPSLFSDELAEAICALLADGRTLTEIGAMPDMPDRATIQRWKLDNELFCGRCQRAQELGAEAMVDQCLSIADESSRDTYVDDNGNERTNSEVVARSKLRVDTRMRIAAILNSRMAPKTKTEVTGADGKPMEVNATTTLSDATQRAIDAIAGAAGTIAACVEKAGEG